MRRRIASLLAFVLIFTSGLHAFASEPDWETGENIGGSSVSSMPEPDAAEQQEKEKAIIGLGVLGLFLNGDGPARGVEFHHAEGEIGRAHV